jgi:hypothetical protein
MIFDAPALVPPSVTRLLDRIQACFNAVPACFEEHRQDLQLELAHYENIQKAAAQLATALDLAGPGSFSDADIAKQPMGNTFFVVKNSYARLGDELANSTLPGLRDKLVQISKLFPKWDAFQKAQMADLRRLLQQYETEFEQILRWKRQMTTASQFCEATFEFGTKGHIVCVKLFEGMKSAEQATMQELKKTEDFQRALVAQEDLLIGGATEVLYAALPFAEPPPVQKRPIATEDSIWAIGAELSGLFLEMRSFIGANRVLQGEFAPKSWAEEREMQPFYARIWADCEGAGEVLAVRRKEIVQVLAARNSPYWRCQRASGEQGFVLAAVLEPLD